MGLTVCPRPRWKSNIPEDVSLIGAQFTQSHRSLFNTLCSCHFITGQRLRFVPRRLDEEIVNHESFSFGPVAGSTVTGFVFRAVSRLVQEENPGRDEVLDPSAVR